MTRWRRGVLLPADISRRHWGGNTFLFHSSRTNSGILMTGRAFEKLVSTKKSSFVVERSASSPSFWRYLHDWELLLCFACSYVLLRQAFIICSLSTFLLKNSEHQPSNFLWGYLAKYIHLSTVLKYNFKVFVLLFPFFAASQFTCTTF